MILFVFEGKRESKWFRSINRLFFKDEIVEYFIVGSTFHSLYKTLIQNEWDIVGTLKQMEKDRGGHKLDAYNVSDFAEVYLFFDYDPHSRINELDILNSELQELLSFFDNETENGKLYINYPMLEALRYTKELPDEKYFSYIYPIAECVHFKEASGDFSFYSGTSFLTAESDQTAVNWSHLKNQNVKKASYICCGVNSMPEDKSSISQKLIFESQIAKYVQDDNPSVSILSALAIFLYDYMA